MMVQWPVARFWVLLSAWHVLLMSAQVLSRVSCPIVQSPVVEGQVRWHCRFSCEAFFLSVRWRCDGVVTRPGCLTPLKWMNGLFPVTQTDERRESSCYTLVPLDGSKHHTMIVQLLFVFCFSFLTAHDKRITFYSLAVTHLTFYKLLGYCQGDIRSWCNLWYMQYELQTLVQSRRLKKQTNGGIMNPTIERETSVILAFFSWKLKKTTHTLKTFSQRTYINSERVCLHTNSPVSTAKYAFTPTSHRNNMYFF